MRLSPRLEQGQQSGVIWVAYFLENRTAFGGGAAARWVAPGDRCAEYRRAFFPGKRKRHKKAIFAAAAARRRADLGGYYRRSGGLGLSYESGMRNCIRKFFHLELLDLFRTG